MSDLIPLHTNSRSDPKSYQYGRLANASDIRGKSGILVLLPGKLEDELRMTIHHVPSTQASYEALSLRMRTRRASP